MGSDVVIVARVCAVTSRRDLLDERMHIEETGFLGRLAGPYFTTAMNRVPQTQGAYGGNQTLVPHSD